MTHIRVIGWLRVKNMIRPTGWYCSARLYIQVLNAAYGITNTATVVYGKFNTAVAGTNG